MKTRLWLALFGLVIMLAVWLCADGAKRQFPTERVSPMAVVRRSGLVFSYRGPGQDNGIWLRPITSAPGLQVSQTAGETPRLGEALNCSSSTRIVGHLKEDNTAVTETLLQCDGESGQAVFRVTGVTL